MWTIKADHAISRRKALSTVINDEGEPLYSCSTLIEAMSWAFEEGVRDLILDNGYMKVQVAMCGFEHQLFQPERPRAAE